MKYPKWKPGDFGLIYYRVGLSHAFQTDGHPLGIAVLAARTYSQTTLKSSIWGVHRFKGSVHETEKIAR